jgi:hypothetical protein
VVEVRRTAPSIAAQGDRVVGVKPHDDRARRGRKAGRDEHRADIHARFLQDRQIDEHDVGHGEEGREPGVEFAAMLVPCANSTKKRSSAFCGGGASLGAG